MEITIEYGVLLVITGLIAGVINTLAGGGSNLTLPALMVMGMPADIANATNRVGVVLQAVVATHGFNKHEKLPKDDLLAIMWPTIIGGLFGSVAASYAPTGILKPLLLGAMIIMTLIILFRPGVISPPPDTIPHRMSEKRSAWWWLMVAGFYGGFVQAGVGFMLITVIAGTLRYDLVRTNAIKVVCTLLFTAVALGVFIARDQVWWIPGLLLACGTMAGASLAVRFAIKVQPSVLKWFLLVMTVSGSIAAMLN